MNYSSLSFTCTYLIQSEALLGQLALVNRADLPLLTWAIHNISGRAQHACNPLLVVLQRVVHYGF